MLLLNRANELLAENKLREAEFMYKSVLKQNPKNGPALFGIGRICMRLEQFDNAIYYLKRACEHLPKMLDPLYALADAFIAVGSPVDAKTVLEYTLSVARHNAHAHYYLGQFYLDYGFVKQADNVLQQGLTCPRGPVTIFMLYELVQISDIARIDDYQTIAEQILAESQNTRVHILSHFVIAKCLERKQDYKEAFKHFTIANQSQYALCEFKTKDMLPFFSSVRSWCDSAFFSQPIDTVKSSFVPTFIVGLPRTGSTLLEQMLVQHSEIGSMGESTILSSEIVPYLAQRKKKDFPYCLHDIPTSVLDYCRGLYVDEIKRHRVSEEVVINKLPANFQNIGLIYLLFPEARIIHLSRSFNANAWSVYSNHFAENEPYFCSWTDYQLYAEQEKSLMTHFKSMLPRSIYQLSYEQLLAEPERYIKQTLNFLYQKFEPECLTFYKAKTPVKTLSKSEVRKPLSSNSLFKWENYKQDIESVLVPMQNAETTQSNP